MVIIKKVEYVNNLKMAVSFRYSQTQIVILTMSILTTKFKGSYISVLESGYPAIMIYNTKRQILDVDDYFDDPDTGEAKAHPHYAALLEIVESVNANKFDDMTKEEMTNKYGEVLKIFNIDVEKLYNCRKGIVANICIIDKDGRDYIGCCDLVEFQKIIDDPNTCDFDNMTLDEFVSKFGDSLINLSIEPTACYNRHKSFTTSQLEHLDHLDHDRLDLLNQSDSD